MHTTIIPGKAGKRIFIKSLYPFSWEYIDMSGKGSPEFVELMQQCIDLHYKKNADYASNANSFSNFEFSAFLISHFNLSIDKVFMTLISTKLSRLSELLNQKEQPKNESIEDTFKDLVNYCGLWAAHYIRSQNGGSNPNTK